MNLKSGDTIGGRYEIVRALTPGNQGLTYLAKDTQQQGNAQCVVKQLKPRISSTSILQEAQKRFKQEATILERLGDRHEQIPKLWASFQEESEFYLVQELIPGQNLSDELNNLKDKRLSEAQAIVLLRDVLGILEFVHQQQVIHRDIKPSNLIRRESDGLMVLIDFGIVKELGTLSIDPQSQTFFTKAVGTPAYMPPEQLEGRPHYSSDIYGLGVTAIQALIGYCPQQDPKTGEIIWLNRVQASGKLVEILDKMVRPNLSDRYQSVSDVLKDLEPLTKIGKTLAGRYQLKDYLGGGIFGHTYLAEDLLRRYQSRCIVKQLQPNSKDPVVLEQAEKRFATEVKVLEELKSHSQIPKLLDHFEIEEKFYLVQEFIQGEEFSVEIANGKRLSQEQVVDFLLDVLPILEFIHDRNVIHCDIKPSNLIRRKSDRKIVLIDFGAVKEIVKVTMNVTIRNNSSQPPIGTEGYMPPEQMAGTTNVASDFYALGVTAIQALTGISPDRFSKDTQTGEIIWQQGIQIHPTLAQVLDKMVLYDFRQRYRQASEAIKELLKIPRSDQPKQRWKFFNGRWRWVMLAILVIVAVILFDSCQANKAFDLFFKGNDFFTKGEYEKAIESYDAALEINARYNEAWTNKGIAYGHLKNHLEMYDSCNEATKIEPKDFNAWNCKGQAKYALERYKDASEDYQKAIDIKPDDPLFPSNKGESLLELKQYERAIGLFDQALKLDPEYLLALNNKGRALREQKQYDEALDIFEKATNIARTKGEYSFTAERGLGLAYKDLKQYEKAMNTFNEILQQPSVSNAQKAEIWYYKGSIRKASNRCEEANDAFNEALRLNPDYSAAAKAKDACSN